MKLAGNMIVKSVLSIISLIIVLIISSGSPPGVTGI
jgi:hypothetical protein